MCTRKPWLANRTSSPSCRRTGPRNANSMEAIVACGLGNLAGDAAFVITNGGRGGCPDGAKSAAMYCPGARLACADLVPLLACGEKTNDPSPALSFRSAANFGSAAQNSARVTPGSRRTSTGAPCASPLTLDTIRTPPDCKVPPTVIFLPVMVIVIFGKVLAGLAADPDASRTGAAPAMPVENAIETVAAIETP